MKTNRLIVYPKDVQRITGKGERYSRKILDQVRKQYNKQPHQFISVNEFCEFSGLHPDTVSKYLND